MRLTSWLTAHLPGCEPPVTLEPLPGGRSNISLLVTDAHGVRHLLRRPPSSSGLATAHDVLREARIVTALSTTAVPVAPVVATCTDVTVVGVPFVVSRFVDGPVLRDAASARMASPRCRATSGRQLVGALARLHRLTPTAVGLPELERDGDYGQRQLRRWTRQLQAGGPEHRPELLDLARRLAPRLPAQQRRGLVHGDPKLDNCVLDEDGHLLALVDWELTAAGDPVADLALLLAYWAEPGDAEVALQDPPTRVPGFAGRDELLSHYADEAGWEPVGVHAYLAFCYWKLACIVHGVLHRGTAVTDPEPFRRQVRRLARLSAAALEGGS